MTSMQILKHSFGLEKIFDLESLESIIIAHIDFLPIVFSFQMIGAI